MPLQDLLPNLGVLPLRMIVFQILFLLVAIALEAAVLRQRLRLGYQPSVHYATTVNLLAVSIGWLVFFIIEPLTPILVRSQIISFVLFDRFYANAWSENLALTLVLVGFGCFFGTLLLKLQGLRWLMRLMGTAPTQQKPAQISRSERYAIARRGRIQIGHASDITLAVLQANALSFSVLLGLMLLLPYIEMGQ